MRLAKPYQRDGELPLAVGARVSIIQALNTVLRTARESTRGILPRFEIGRMPLVLEKRVPVRVVAI